MNPLFWLVRLVRNFEAFISMAAFAIMVLVVSANVTIRFATGNSLVFTEEVAYLAFGYSVFFGVALLFRIRAMIAVDLVVDLFPPAVQRVVNIVNYLILIAVNGYFFFISAKLASVTWIRRTAFLEIPYFWINLAPTIAFGLMTIYSVWFLYLLLRGQELPSVELEEQM
jgi:TRAP-type C4-dicarboxylate transport system permease small subunit